MTWLSTWLIARSTASDPTQDEASAMTQAPDRLITAREIAELPDDQKRYELVRGRLVAGEWSGSRAAVVAMNLAVAAHSYAEARSLGQCLGANAGMHQFANPDTVRAPDFAFIRAERLLARLPDDYWPGAPDIAAEVLDPDDRFAFIMDKVQDSLTAGTRLLWVIDPGGRQAWVFRPDGQPAAVDENGVLDGEDVLPDFSLPLRDVLV
jgi:Uma2 family endonuclease